MENVQEETTNKDYWKKASREFSAVAYFALVIFLIAIAVRLFSSNQEAKAILTPVTFLLFFIAIVAWFMLGHFFRTHNKLAVPLGLVINGLGLVMGIVRFNIVVLLIFAYFFYIIFRAKKQQTDP